MCPPTPPRQLTGSMSFSKSSSSAPMMATTPRAPDAGLWGETGRCGARGGQIWRPPPHPEQLLGEGGGGATTHPVQGLLRLHAAPGGVPSCGCGERRRHGGGGGTHAHTCEMSLWGLGPPSPGSRGAVWGWGGAEAFSPPLAPGPGGAGGTDRHPLSKGALCRTKGPIESPVVGGGGPTPAPPCPSADGASGGSPWGGGGSTLGVPPPQKK